MNELIDAAISNAVMIKFKSNKHIPAQAGLSSMDNPELGLKLIKLCPVRSLGTLDAYLHQPEWELLIKHYEDNKRRREAVELESARSQERLQEMIHHQRDSFRSFRGIRD